MATTIQNLHSLSAGNLPGDLLPGQVAYNLSDGDVYLGNGGNNYLDTLGNVIGPAIITGQGWQQAIFNASPVNGSAILGGLYDAIINEVTATTAAGITAGLTAGDPLPASAAGNTDVYVLVQVGGTMTPPAPTGDAEVGDWIISTGNGWSLINQSSVTIPAQNVTVVPTGDITSTNVQSAIQELDTQKYDQAGGPIGGKVIIDTGLADADALSILSGGGAQIEGELNVDGAVTFGDTLTATGAIVSGGSVSCSGVTSNGSVIVTGAVTATAAVTGASGSFGTLAVSSTSSFVGAITSNILSVAQSLNVGTAAGGDSMVVQAASSFTQPATFSAAANFSDDNSFSGLKTTTFAAGTTLDVQGKFKLASANDATVNGANLASQLLPLAAILTMPTGVLPTYGDWARCEGQSLDRTTYATLFALIGTTYGSSSGTTFKIPDYRGLFLRGCDQNGTVNESNGTKAGTAGRLPGSTQVDAFRSHNHKLLDVNGTPLQSQWRNSFDTLGSGNPGTGFLGGLTSSGNVWASLPYTSTEGGSDETVPVNMAVQFIMRIK
jgi:hypothetical protein